MIESNQISDALRDLVPFVQFRKRKNVCFRMKRKVVLFSRCLMQNCHIVCAKLRGDFAKMNLKFVFLSGKERCVRHDQGIMRITGLSVEAGYR